MKIICISGKAQHGKDTAASYLKQFLELDGKRVLVTHYADLLKYICKTFFGWNGEKDEEGRALLQRVGTDVVRAMDMDFWTNFLLDILTFFPDEWDYVIVADCRFFNELHFFEQYGYDVTHVRVVRENYDSNLTEEQQNHESETALDDVVPDWIIDNSGSLSDFCVVLETFAKAIM